MKRGFRGSPKLVEAVLTFRKALDLLKTLHHSGVLHGDIHLGNIVFKVPRGDDPEKYNWLADELTLIDFGEAQYFIPRKGRELTPKKLNTTYLLPLALSPWELQGSMAGPRDDFFRLFERISEVLSNGARGNRKAMMSHHLATDNPFLEPTWKAGRMAKAGR